MRCSDDCSGCCRTRDFSSSSSLKSTATGADDASAALEPAGGGDEEEEAAAVDSAVDFAEARLEPVKKRPKVEVRIDFPDFRMEVR